MRKIKDILIDNGFRFNHNLGQNFITDKNLLDKIVELSGVDENDVVVEIGTGAGTLTRAIAEKAKKVYSFEVDRALKPVLDETLSGLDKVEVIFKDVLKMKDKELLEIVGEKFKVVANIPYYITTALVMRFLEEGVHPSAITVMVQKEVADRFVAKPATEDYGAITMAISLYGDAKIDNHKYKSFFGAKAKMLKPEEVNDLIGHGIGGVCPFGINDGVTVYLDESLKRFGTVFPACGSSNSAIELSIPELEKYSNFVEWIDVCKI